MNRTDPTHPAPRDAPPPDRGHLDTEQRHPTSMDLHELDTAGIVARIHAQDRTIADAVAHALPAITRYIEAIEPRFLDGGRMVYLGAGTSGRLGVLDAAEMPPTFQIDPNRFIGIIAGGDAALRRSSEGLEDDPQGGRVALDAVDLTERDSVLGIAAGGTTPYVHGGLALAHERGCVTGLLTCVKMPVEPHIDHMLHLDTGAELIAGSTRMKAGTATKMALNTISTTLMIRAGRVYQNLMVDLKASNQKLRDRAARIITTLTDLDRSAAFALLDRANGEVKTALVMHHRGVDADGARTLLAEAEHRLEKVIDP